MFPDDSGDRKSGHATAYVSRQCLGSRGLRCSDIRFALETPRLTTTEAGQLADPVTGELADLIENMISSRLNKRQIWIELMDHHDYLVKYHSIRQYIDYTRDGRQRKKAPRR
ncbi:hypothetical protein HRW11_03475 [Streptomyces lunaelactis]|uniref:hypothetical protein n=1 Tax=Streptomyces lunaelactis TaxID=1535768 RepID=UPI00158574BD|nr:hypothetical protein [Streptomyces lunaelactis]NUK63187.1 hypothetical protein [Streptomyces lunaelactis]